MYVAGTLRLTTTTVDNTWPGGCVGLWRSSGTTTTTLPWDNFKCGKDRNADGDVDDAGDALYADYDFNDPGGSTWQTITLSHDDAGNLTNDGLFQYTYDAWNRLVEVYYAAGDATDSTERVAAYAYDGLSRRVTKDVGNQGSGYVYGSDAGGATGILAGDRSEQYYYAGWRVVELRDKATPAATLGQFAYGTQYIDEGVAYDRNTDVNSDNDCLDSGGSQRYVYHQDVNYRVAALTREDGTLVERYEYSAYGEPTVLRGVPSGGSAENGAVTYASTVGNPLMHQGLWRDGEAKSYQNRYRTLNSVVGRFLQRDPLGYADGMNQYEALGSDALDALDPRGLYIRQHVFSNSDGTITVHYYDERWVWFFGWWLTNFDYLGTLRYDPNDDAAKADADRRVKAWEVNSSVNQVGDALAAGVLIGTTLLPGPEDIVIAWLAIKGFRIVKGKLVDAAGRELAEAEVRAVANEYKALRTKAGSPVWQSSHPYKGSIRRSGNGEELWKWDSSHGGEIECYDLKGRHLGTRDPVSGDPVKPPVPGRDIKDEL